MFYGITVRKAISPSTTGLRLAWVDLHNTDSIGTETSELIMQGASLPVNATYNKLSETADANDSRMFLYKQLPAPHYRSVPREPRKVY